MNRYTYAGNNPLMYVDPSGRIYTLVMAVWDCESCVAASSINPVGAAVVAAVAVAAVVTSLGYDLGWWGGNSFQGNVQTSQTGKNVPQTPSAPSNPGLFSCAANFANEYSIAGGLNSLGIGNSGGVGGFLTSALGGNTFSGLTNAVNDGVLSPMSHLRNDMGFGGATAAQEGISGIVNNTVAGGFWVRSYWRSAKHTDS